MISGPPTQETNYKRPTPPDVVYDPGFEDFGYNKYNAGSEVIPVTAPVFEGKYAAKVVPLEDTYGAMSPNTTWDYEWNSPGIYLYEAWWTVEPQHDNGGAPGLAVEPISKDPTTAEASRSKLRAYADQVAKKFPPPAETTRVIKDINGTEWTWRYIRNVQPIIFGSKPTIMKSPLTGGPISKRLKEFYVDNYRIRKIGELPPEAMPPIYKMDKKLLEVAPAKTESLSDVSQHYRVEVMGKAGLARRSHGEAGVGVSEFRHPMDITLDCNGILYVADTENHRIQMRDKKGAWKTDGACTAFGSHGIAPGEFNYPMDIASARTERSMWLTRAITGFRCSRRNNRRGRNVMS